MFKTLKIITLRKHANMVIKCNVKIVYIILG